MNDLESKREALRMAHGNGLSAAPAPTLLTVTDDLQDLVGLAQKNNESAYEIIRMLARTPPSLSGQSEIKAASAPQPILKDCNADIQEVRHQLQELGHALAQIKRTLFGPADDLTRGEG